jgi:pimeloyl-ACP methyl ester carboxylesterase
MQSPRLHVDVDGTGPAIVLAHGLGGSARNFGPQMRALKDRYRVIRYDARGHGRSDAPHEASVYTPEAFVGDMARVLEDAGERTAVVGGLDGRGHGAPLLAHPARARPRAVRVPGGPDDPGGSRRRRVASRRRSSATASSGGRRLRVGAVDAARSAPCTSCSRASSSIRRTGSPSRSAA